MDANKIKSNTKGLVSIFLVCLMAGAVTVVMAGGHGGFHGEDRGGGFHRGGDFYRGGFYDHGFGFRGFPFHQRWGGFYIGSSWFDGPTLVIAGAPYYYYAGDYYTPYGDYLVVAPPPPVSSPAATTNTVTPAPATPPAMTSPAAKTNTVTLEQAAPPAKLESDNAKTTGEPITINVPNENGGFTPIKLIPKDKGYIGPQGEYYPGHPTVGELKVLYGK